MRVQMKSALWIIVIIVITPFIWIFLFNNGEEDLSEVDLMEKRLTEMRDRLHYAESLNREREHELMNLRNHIGKFKHSKNNINLTLDQYFPESQLFNISRNFNWSTSFPNSGTDLSLPNVYHYLPHLLKYPDAIRPSIRISGSRLSASIVIGVPTIKRVKESYLLRTLQSLIDSLNDDEKLDCLIIVFIAEKYDIEFINDTIDQIKQNFATALISGLLEVIVPASQFYPSFDDLQDRFGDTIERVRWRTKQNLDYTYMMMYCRSRGIYYVQLEDDVMTKPGYLSLMKNFALKQQDEDWILLEFSHLGFIGKLFKSRDLPFIVEFFLMFHRDKPVDWLLDHLLYVKVCNPEKDNKHCQRSIETLRHRYKPSLFQHIGTYSSLRGKVQKLKDKDFGKGMLHQAHVNPIAEVSTTLKVHEHYSLERAYMGETFFWGILPQQHDTLVFKFSPSVKITKYLLRSGNPEHPGDRFYNTSVEVLPNPDQPFTAPSKHYVPTEDGFYALGRFDSNTGIAQGNVPDWVGLVDVFRLYVQSSSKSWVILSEILFKISK